MREVLGQQIHGAEIAEDKRNDDAAKPDQEADERVLEEHLQVRLKAGEEEQYHRRESRDSVERGRRGVEHVARLLRDGPELGAVEESAREKAVADADAAESPRAYDYARREFAENRRKAQHRGERPADARCEDYDADLHYEEHHLLYARQPEVGIRRRRAFVRGERACGKKRSDHGKKRF